MTIERPTLNHECHVRKLFLIQHVVNSYPQSILLFAILARILNCAKIGTWIRVENVNIFQVVLTVATTNDVEFAVDKSH